MRKILLLCAGLLVFSSFAFQPVLAARPELKDLASPGYFSLHNLRDNFVINVTTLVQDSYRVLSKLSEPLKDFGEKIWAKNYVDTRAPLAQLNSILPEAPVSSPSPDTSPTTDSLETKVSNLQGLVSQVQDLIALNQQTKSTALTQPVLNNPIVTSTTDDVKNLIAQLQQKQEADRRALFQAISMTNRINYISGATINNPTFTSLSLSDSDIPDSITASNYLSLSGGNVTGKLGIGTSTPATNLGIQGNAYLTGNISNVADVTATGTITTVNLTVTGTCTGCSGGGASYDWQKESNFNTLTLTPTTTIPIWLKSALYASSTVTIQGATGVGTSSPSKAFAVQGDAMISGTATVGNLTATNTITTTDLTINGTCTGCGSSSAADWVKGTNFGVLTLTASTTIPYWAKSAIYASSTLIVNGPANFNTITATSTLDVTGLSTLGGFISTASSTAQGNFSAGGLSLNVDATNVRVGIGTSTPKTILDVFGAGSGSVNLQRLTYSGTIGSVGGNLGFYYSPLNLEIGRIENFIDDASNASLRFYTYNSGASEKMRITGAGNVGLGTTTPFTTLQALHSTKPQLVLTDFSGGTDDKHRYASSTNGSFTLGILNDSLNTITEHFRIDDRGRVGIGTTSLNYNLSLASTTAAFNSGSSGALSAWSTNANTIPASIQLGATVYANGYVYVIGGSTPTNVATVYYAKIYGNGSVGTFAQTTSLPAIRTAGTAVTYNGYIYYMGGGDSSDVNQTTVYYTRINNDGTLGPWSTTTVLPAANGYHMAMVANGYVYDIGGQDLAVYYSKVNADGTLGAWVTTTAMPEALQQAGVAYANGYLYTVGGRNTGGTAINTIYYAKVQFDGSLGAWATNANNLTAAQKGNAAVAINGYMYSIAGVNSAGSTISTVYAGPLQADGSIGAFAIVNRLPAVRGFFGSATANGYLYVLGGSADAGSTSVNTVYYASIPRTSFATAIDLVGLASTTLAGVTGSQGVPLYAGDISATNNLEVGGKAQIWNGLGVNGTFLLKASTTLNQTNSIFGIHNATGTAPLFTVLYNGRVGIGTTSPKSALSIEGTCVDIGGGCADFAELYPASEDVASGDILALDSDHPQEVKRATTADAAKLIGVVSTNPAVIIEGSGLQLMSGNYKVDPRKPAVALSGRIPVKVNLEGGAIEVGDPITISSVAGVGKKATMSSRIIGYALEQFTQATTDNDGKVLIFSSLENWQAPIADSITSGNSLVAAAVSAVQQWLESLQVFIENGIVRLKKLFVHDIEIGSSDRPSGITMYDKITKAPYCVSVTNGQVTTESGVCADASETQLTQPSAPTPPPAEETASTTDTQTPPPAEEIQDTTASTTETTITTDTTETSSTTETTLPVQETGATE